MVINETLIKNKLSKIKDLELIQLQSAIEKCFGLENMVCWLNETQKSCYSDLIELTNFNGNLEYLEKDYIEKQEPSIIFIYGGQTFSHNNLIDKNISDDLTCEIIRSAIEKKGKELINNYAVNTNNLNENSKTDIILKRVEMLRVLNTYNKIFNVLKQIKSDHKEVEDKYEGFKFIENFNIIKDSFDDSFKIFEEKYKEDLQSFKLKFLPFSLYKKILNMPIDLTDYSILKTCDSELVYDDVMEYLLESSCDKFDNLLAEKEKQTNINANKLMLVLNLKKLGLLKLVTESYNKDFNEFQNPEIISDGNFVFNLNPNYAEQYLNNLHILKGCGRKKFIDNSMESLSTMINEKLYVNRKKPEENV